jgi:hypothetical protein
MVQSARHGMLESRSSRLGLTARGKPYWGPRLAPGLKLGYRRLKAGNGKWIAKVAGASGAYTELVIGETDDFTEADGVRVFTFFSIQPVARALRYGDAAASAALTIDVALKRYVADLKSRSADAYNADRVRFHLKGNPLLTKPLATITVDELKAWRDTLVAKGLAASTVNRTRNAMRAALELAMPNRTHVWKQGLETLPNAQRARRLFVPDKTINALVAAAYARDDKFGLLCDVLAKTGTRPIQAQRLLVEDLVADTKKPKLMMSKSAKGGGRKRAEKKLQRYAVPIPPGLAAKLKQAAKGHTDHERLLIKSDGKPWNEINPSNDYRYLFAEIVEAVGLTADSTAYLFRHSSIKRMLLAGVHTKLVADHHDTSEQMLRQHYAKYVGDHTDDIMRAVMLQDEPPAGDVVVAFTKPAA